MATPQIDKLISILENIASGIYQFELPVFESPEFQRLAESIQHASASFEKKYRRQRLLNSITEYINNGLTLNDILDYVYNSFQEIIPYDRIGIALIEEEKKLIKVCCVRSKATVIKINRGYSAPIEGSSLAAIIESGQPRIINDLEIYLKNHPDSVSTRLILEEGMRSSLTCPLISSRKPAGFIFFSSMQVDTYKDLHIDIFLEIARQLSVIFEKSRMYEELIQLNELKNKFLGIAAHDLRSPIGVIKNFIILFLNGYIGEIDEKQRKVLMTMDKNCDRMLNLIHNLLDFSAIESGKLDLKLEQLDLHKFFHTYQSMTKSLAEKKQIELKMEINI